MADSGLARIDILAVAFVLQSDLITCDPQVEKAERSLEEYTTAKHAVVV